MFYSKSTGGFYDIEIHGDEIPEDAVNITAAEHAALFDAQSQGKRIADAGGFPIAVDRPPLALADAQSAALLAIDNAAGSARARYITVVNGQAETYIAKATDAERYKAAGYPDTQIGNYPWVRAKAQALSATPTAVDYQTATDLILSTRDAWVAKGTLIEIARERGKAGALAASIAAEVEAARATAISALSQI